MKALVDFLKDKKASITVEMVGIFSLLVLLIALVHDIGNSLVVQAKLNNLSYSLASLIRERSDLYPNKKNDFGVGTIQPNVTEDEVEELYKIALDFIKDSAISESDLTLVVQSLSFDGVSADDKGEPIKRDPPPKGELECEPPKDIEELKDLSFFTKIHTWASLYQVTVCAKAKDSFAPKFAQIFIKPIANSIVYGR